MTTRLWFKLYYLLETIPGNSRFPSLQEGWRSRSGSGITDSQSMDGGVSNPGSFCWKCSECSVGVTYLLMHMKPLQNSWFKVQDRLFYTFSQLCSCHGVSSAVLFGTHDKVAFRWLVCRGTDIAFPWGTPPGRADGVSLHGAAFPEQLGVTMLYFQPWKSVDMTVQRNMKHSNW